MEEKDEVEDSRSALHDAASTGQYSNMLLLLSDGADVNSTNHKGDKPAHICARLGHVSCLELLIAYGALIGCYNCDGLTPIEEAEINGHSEIVKLIDENFYIESREIYCERPKLNNSSSNVSRGSRATSRSSKTKFSGLSERDFDRQSDSLVFKSSSNINMPNEGDCATFKFSAGRAIMVDHKLHSTDEGFNLGIVYHRRFNHAFDERIIQCASNFEQMKKILMKKLCQQRSSLIIQTSWRRW